MFIKERRKSTEKKYKGKEKKQMRETSSLIKKWFFDEKASVVSEKSLIIAVCVIAGIALGAVALPALKDYGEGMFEKFAAAVDRDGFLEE